MMASLLLQPAVPFFLRETVEIEDFALPPKTPDACSHMKPRWPPVAHSLRSKRFQLTYAVNPLLSPPSQISPLTPMSPLFSGEES